MSSQTSRLLCWLAAVALSLVPSWVPVAAAQTPAVRLVPAPSNPPPGQWLHCAMEGGQCHVKGPHMVRYGVPGFWVYGNTTNNFSCTNGTFGDPKPGTKKDCYFQAPQPLAPWTRCAVEGGKCNILDQQTTRYGANAWTYGIFNSTFNCTNGTFGDPQVGTRKGCYYNAPPPQGPWTLCAIEGGRCNFYGRKSVRYGVPGDWVYGDAYNGISCNNATFGDPRVGTQKRCYYRQ